VNDNLQAKPVIEINDLQHVYLRGTPLETTALRGITLEVKQGESIGIIGRTGAGKSTVVQHINGLIRPRQPGKVIIDGQDMSDPSVKVRAIRQKVGLVFQHPEQQLFERLVGDDIAFGPKKLGMPREERRERVRWAMEMVGLDFDQFKDRFTFSLSGGEMRKVAIAGVLALRPKVLILDESTTGVDPRGRKELLARILDLHDQHGVTLIFVSPNMEEVATMVDRIYVIDEGRTVMSNTTREIFARPDELRKYGLGVPQVTTVAHRLRDLGLPVARTPLTVPEAEEDVWKILSS
jgi:energy-coupling factor transport system ATP-binding protein